MATTVFAISSNLIKKVIPFWTPNSRTRKTSKTPTLLFSSAIPMTKIMNKHAHDKSNPVSLVAQLLVNNQSNSPPEIPSNTPPEFPRKPDYDLPSVPPVPELPKGPEIETSPPDVVNIEPPTIPEVPNPGPDFPVTPLPSPPTRPDVPLPPPPGAPEHPPPDQLPPGSPPDPDILPPPSHPLPDILPPPDTPPDIKPPTGPFVV